MSTYFADNEWPKIHKTLNMTRKCAMKKNGDTIYELDSDNVDHPIGDIYPKNGKWYWETYKDNGKTEHIWIVNKDGSLGTKIY